MAVEKVDFDKHADEYDKILAEDLDFFGEENNYFAEYKVKIVKDTLGFEPKNILEYGCGIGRNLKFFSQYFPSAKITGCDISARSLELAKKENPSADFFLIDEQNVSARGGQYDLIFISCVFHHIAPELRKGAITNIYNLLKQSGAAYIFEHNPYNPVTQKIVKDCVWDTDAILLKAKESVGLMEHAGLKITEKKYTLFFPAFLKAFRFMEKFLSFIPMGGQYYVKGVK
jgi:SAM-dependent methyltransferase